MGTAPTATTKVEGEDNTKDHDFVEISQDADDGGLSYMTGYDNTFESECIGWKGALPMGRNNPRLVPYGLFVEQLSGTAFTCPRHTNLRTWLYRIKPSVVHNDQSTFQDSGSFFGNEDPSTCILDPNPLRWLPFTETDTDVSSASEDGDTGTLPKEVDTNFITGMHLLGTSGSPETKHGLSIYVYMFHNDMTKSHMYNSDGDLLILPQQGSLLVSTEMGRMIVKVGEFSVIPRGIVFSINRYKTSSESGDGEGESHHGDDNTSLYRGYVLEIYKGHFTLPELGPIGSNGLANARDFQYPTAWIEDKDNGKDGEGASPPSSSAYPATLYNKFGSKLFTKQITTSPYNVVAYHGNYLPFKYNLSKFCAVNSVSYDHLDPSIYTVLTCKGGDEPNPGTALCDFVIFPPRIMATDSNTFRPPWFHRNTMTEFMGLLYGEYDAKAGSSSSVEGQKPSGFLPGGASLHSCMTPHGPDKVSYEKAIADPCESPTKFDKGLAFMFETSCILRLSKFALTTKHNLDEVYGHCWNF